MISPVNRCNNSASIFISGPPGSEPGSFFSIEVEPKKNLLERGLTILSRNPNFGFVFLNVFFMDDLWLALARLVPGNYKYNCNILLQQFHCMDSKWGFSSLNGYTDITRDEH